MPGSVEVHLLHLSEERLKALTSRERYVFLLLGHIFNELMVLQKLTLASQQGTMQGEKFQQTGAVGYVLVLLRVLAGKTYEALLTLRRHSIDMDLRRDYFEPAGLTREWDDVLATADGLHWLSKLRNQHAFHYLKAGQWLGSLGQDVCEGAEVIVGRRYGDTFFHWSDALAGLHLMRLVNEAEPFEGLGTILQDLGRVVGKLLDVLAQALQTRMVDHLTDERALDDAVIIEAPLLAEIRVPYFWAYEGELANQQQETSIPPA